MSFFLKNVRFTLVLATSSGLMGCAATQTYLEHRKLEVQTQLSKTLFLEPVKVSEKTVFLQIKNTSGEPLSMAKPLKMALAEKGYRIVTNPNSAHYVLQANVLKMGKMSIAASQSALGGGFGSALGGVMAGSALGALSGNGKAILAGGVSGGLVGLAADSLVKDVNYTLITDLQIREKNGKKAKTNKPYHYYRARVVSHANQVNLTFKAARLSLEQGLVKVIAGIF